MRKWFLILSAVFLLVTLTTLVNCNLGSAEYTLIVEVGEGIVGFPQGGTYEHIEFTEVEFKYESIAGGTPPQVFLNATRMGSEGAVKIFADAKLTVKQTDIRAKFEITLLIANTNAEVDKYNITFSGSSNLGGIFVDERGRGGTWIIEGDQVAFKYTDWLEYRFNGSVISMTGLWTGDGREGNWTATEVIDN